MCAFVCVDLFSVFVVDVFIMVAAVYLTSLVSCITEHIYLFIYLFIYDVTDLPHD